MKPRYLFSIFAAFLFSCTNRDSSKYVYNASYETDTAYIHSILKKVKSDSFNTIDSTVHYLKAAIARSEKIGHLAGKTEALFLMANLLYDQNKYREALSLYNQALGTAMMQSDILLEARCLERIASIDIATGDDHDALKLYHEALILFKKTSDKEGIAKMYNIIGLHKNSENKYDTAEIYLNKAIALNTEIGNTRGLLHNKGNLGYIYERSGQLDKAEQMYTALIDSLNKPGDSVYISMILSKLASINLRKNIKDKSFIFLKKAINIAEKIRDTSILALLYADIGELNLNSYDFDSAEVFLNKSVLYAKSMDDAVTQLHATRLLLRSDTLRNNFREASARLNSISILSDTVYARKVRHSLKASILQYDNQKKSQLIESQLIDMHSTRRQSQLYLELLLLATLSVVLLILVIVLRIRNNKRKQEIFEENLIIRDLELENSIKEDVINKLKISKIEEEIKIKEREQVCAALALEQKNELLNLISEKISESMHDNGTLNVSALNEVVASIKSQLKSSIESNLFNQEFNKLHSNFYTNLKEKHPDLTKSELKFCAYLKLNLGGNQIARLINVTPEAIRKTRYRIRKKINIAPLESLEDYISMF